MNFSSELVKTTGDGDFAAMDAGFAERGHTIILCKYIRSYSTIEKKII